MTKQDEILQEIRDIKRILNGNGEPEKGVVFRLRSLEEKVPQGRLEPKPKVDFANKWLMRIGIYYLLGQEGVKSILSTFGN